MNRVREYRLQAGLTQEQLSVLAFGNRHRQGYLSGLECGRKLSYAGPLSKERITLALEAELGIGLAVEDVFPKEATVAAA